VRFLVSFTVWRGYIFRNGSSLACGVLQHGFGKINGCRRNAIAQAAPSGGSGLGSPRKHFPHTTGSTATTEPQL
jgi:hypothetical protein